MSKSRKEAKIDRKARGAVRERRKSVAPGTGAALMVVKFITKTKSAVFIPAPDVLYYIQKTERTFAMDNSQNVNLQFFPPFRLVAEYADGSRLTFDGLTESEAMERMSAAQALHGDIAWYDGVTDTHYENGRHYAIPQPQDHKKE